MITSTGKNISLAKEEWVKTRTEYHYVGGLGVGIYKYETIDTDVKAIILCFRNSDASLVTNVYIRDGYQEIKGNIATVNFGDKVIRIDALANGYVFTDLLIVR